VSDKKLKIF